MSKQLMVLPGNVPAFLRTQSPAEANRDFVSGITNGNGRPPRISVDGRVFRVIGSDGVAVPVTRKDEDGNDVPVSDLRVVLLGSNPGKYKQFFAKKDESGKVIGPSKYDPKMEASGPSCYSYDGVRPSENSPEQQANSCALCPWNKWGSAVTDNGSQTRACSDNKLLAVIAASEVTKGQGTVYQLKVSPSALSRSKADRKADPANNTSLAEFIELLTQNGVKAHGVVCRLFFDMKASYPLLRFKYVRFLTEQEFTYVESRLQLEDRPDGSRVPTAADVLACISEQDTEPSVAPEIAPMLPAAPVYAKIAAPKPAAKPAVKSAPIELEDMPVKAVVPLVAEAVIEQVQQQSAKVAPTFSGEEAEEVEVVIAPAPKPAAKPAAKKPEPKVAPKPAPKAAPAVVEEEDPLASQLDALLSKVMDLG